MSEYIITRKNKDGQKEYWSGKYAEFGLSSIFVTSYSKKACRFIIGKWPKKFKDAVIEPVNQPTPKG